MIREELLHFIWQSKLLWKHRLKLASGDPLEIISPGIYNRDAGPDFFNSRIRIRDTIWAGNIEFHIRSSDWNLHKHSIDRAYDNVILHVVYQHNTDIHYRDGNIIPVLELRPYLPPVLLRRYRFLQKSKAAIPCYSLFRIPEEPRLSL